MRKVVVAMVALALPFVGAGPASAEPARASAASAFGITINLSGSPLLAPTPTATATFPPGGNEDRSSTVPLNLGTLTVDGVINAVAQARQADELAVALRPDVLSGTSASSEPITLAGPNARGYASAANARVLLNEAVPGLPLPAFELLSTNSLVSADAVQSEAVAKCVNNQPVFDTGFNLTNLRIGGTVIPLVGDLVDTITDILGPDNPLAGLISVSKGQVTPIANGVAITALRVTLLGQPGGTPLVDVVIGQSQVAMPANCAVAPPAAAPTGPGDIAPSLAATGGSDLILPVAAGMLLTGLGLRRLNRRSRRENAAA